ncbi:hypothetical protein [Leptothoe spongobia]|uniref:Uncharacterized protein n=1 Tax=Leptothoe spongobia TAU-MAC 1115 TaxID=1967444 RepID=A0A947DBI5_9CYAN|nr:hypothetical protein [Leptothoe spongobia]MBT9314102.1 hypothetical protein [Leptothoe spongobia TAU-MAC 1115]
MVGRYQHVFPFVLAAVAVIITGKDAVKQPVWAQASPPIVCSYDPSTGIPNPLGMRTFITLTETDGSTEVGYEQFGAVVPGPAEAVLTTERSLVFPNRSIDAVRQLLLNSPNYYQRLVGFNDPDGFAPVNATLICRAEAVAARPGSTRPKPARVGSERSPQRPAASAELPDLSGNPSSRSPSSDLPVLGDDGPRGSTGSSTTPTFYDTIAGLADGNYRYVSGPAAVDRVYSDQELLNRGGVLFIFRKTGDEIIGSYSYIDGEAICVIGRVSGNTVSGQAYPDNGVARDLAEDFMAWGPAKFLRVRRTRGDEGERYYSSATLELNDFSKINAGSVLPPSSCE